MKKVLLLCVAILTMSSAAFAAEKTPVNPKKVLHETVDNLLGDYQVALTKDVKARVVFAVTGKNEILVVDVQTKDPQIKEYIKEKLNYNKVDDLDGVKSKLYTVHMTFSAE
ncbi:MAG: hypothetical protein ACPGRE_02305 [Flavobacteriaceae bacterium]